MFNANLSNLHKFFSFTLTTEKNHLLSLYKLKIQVVNIENKHGMSRSIISLQICSEKSAPPVSSDSRR